jgi:aspartyl-tRNA(Asn)/glutamyl-tRNA(Gln) amidotransferase subunit A
VVRAVRGRRRSPVTTVEGYLALARRFAALGAFSHLDADGALRAAHALARALREGAGPRPGPGPGGAGGGDAAPPLAGLVVGIKDVVAVRGLPWEAGSRLLSGRRAAVDAPVVARLRRAGAIVLGKTTTHEFAIGDAVPPGEGVAGTGVHPWAAGYAPGGSSSGSAIAAAAGLCGVALGTDSGGSVRAPAASVGAVGYVPRRRARRPPAGVVALMPSLDRLGWLGQSVADVALAASGGAVPAAAIAAAGRRPLRRVGVVPEAWRELTDERILARYDAIAHTLAAEGATLVPLALTPWPRWAELWLDHAFETVRVHRALGLWPERAAEYGEGVRALLARGERTPYDRYRAARRERARLARRTDALLADVDALILPTVPFPALPARGAPPERVLSWYAFTLPWNLTGHSALTLCVGHTPAGVGLGLQVVVAEAREDGLLALGRALERRFGAPSRPAAAARP